MTYENYQRWKTQPLKGEPYLSIVVPAYNEAMRIVPTIGAIASHVCDLDIDWELIITDDGSKDDTVALCRALGLANLRVVEAERNGGKGSAVRRGMLAARGRYRLFADADNSTPIEELSRLLAKLADEGYDVAVGSRAAKGAGESNRKLLRRVMSSTLRFLVQNVLRIGVRDTQCGFKMYTAAAAAKLYEAQTINGFSFDLEHLFLAAKWGWRVAEVPVAWVDSPGSKVDAIKESRRFLKDMVTILRNNWRGIYPQAA